MTGRLHRRQLGSSLSDGSAAPVPRSRASLVRSVARFEARTRRCARSASRHAPRGQGRRRAIPAPANPHPGDGAASRAAAEGRTEAHTGRSVAPSGMLTRPQTDRPSIRSTVTRRSKRRISVTVNLPDHATSIRLGSVAARAASLASIEGQSRTRSGKVRLARRWHPGPVSRRHGPSTTTRAASPTRSARISAGSHREQNSFRRAREARRSVLDRRGRSDGRASLRVGCRAAVGARR
jgi:hypothetical protein